MSTYNEEMSPADDKLELVDSPSSLDSTPQIAKNAEGVEARLATAERKTKKLKNEVTALTAQAKRHEAASRFLISTIRAMRHDQSRALKDQRERLEGKFEHRLGSVILATKSLPALLNFPVRLSRERAALKAQSRSAKQIQSSIPPLTRGPHLVSHDLRFFTFATRPDRLVYLAGEVIFTKHAKKNVISAHIRRYINRAPLRGPDEVVDVIISENGAFYICLDPTAGVDSLDIAFSTERGDVALVNIEILERPRPEVAIRWLEKAGTLLRRYGRKSGDTSIENPKTRRPVLANALDTKMWGGYSKLAIPEILSLRDDPEASRLERAAAAWHLARWYYADGDFEAALKHIDYISSIGAPVGKEKLVARILCLIRLSRYNEAEADTARAMSNVGRTPELLLIQSTIARGLQLEVAPQEVSSAESAQLELINEILIDADAAPIRLADATLPLSISNLTTDPCIYDGPQPHKVSIIIPAYNAGATIATAIESLLAQTWSNLEIVVVDDYSSDDTSAVVAEIAERDDRVKLVRSEKNQGAYPSRNIGLTIASGDLITVHDGDDWSHPQKIERQVVRLMETPEAKACMSHWVRVTETLEVIGPWLPKPSIFDLNFSSLMIRREAMEALGPWDEVRVSGDAEYRSRIMRAYGDDAVTVVKNPMCLSFALVRSDSLTQSGPTSIKTIRYGLRAQYRDGYADWHRCGEGDPASLRMTTGQRPYVIPMGIKIDRSTGRRYDLVVASDFALVGGAFGSTLNYILAARKAGMSVAVMHWRKYELRTDASLNPRLYQACIDHGIDILTVGDSVEAETVLIGYPAILPFIPDELPQVKADGVIVMVNQYSARLIDGSDKQYDPVVARQNLNTLFGHEGVWVPISNWVRRLMNEDPSYTKPYPHPWHPMIRSENWFDRPIRWAGRERTRPIVGRHSRDAYTKWPKTPEAVRLAYGVDQAWDVHFLGGARHPISMLGETPRNWNVLKFDGITVPDFLDGLDFFIHYPHEEYIEEFGRAILEAMAAGKPVILPEQFRETFGEAALYAQPSEVAEVINALWNDETAYLERARIGREFVMRFSDLSVFSERYRLIIEHLRDKEDNKAVA